MIRTNIYFLAALAVAVAAMFLVRQRTLNELQAENESQRQQVEAPVSGAASGKVAEVPATNAVAALTAEEKSELLRLRGQVPLLRNEAAEASNRVASLARPMVVAGDRKVSPQMQKDRDAFLAFMETPYYQNANRLAQAVRIYRLQHGGRIPEDLSAVLAPDTNSFTEETVKRFELIRPGVVISEDPEIAPYVFIAHEKEPAQLPDGKWVRLYIQANGGLTVAGPLPNQPPLDDSSFIRQMEETVKQKARAK